MSKKNNSKFLEKGSGIETIILLLVIGFALVYSKLSGNIIGVVFNLIGWSLLLAGFIYLSFYIHKHKEKIIKIKNEFLGALKKKDMTDYSLFDRKYECYGDGFPHRKTHPLEPFVANLIKEGNVLEAGCGSGRILRVLQDKGLGVEGFDISEVAIKICKDGKVKNVGVSSITNFKTRKKYDSILCFNTLHYLKNFRKDFDKLVGLLKKDGRLVVSFGNPIRKANWMNPVKFKEFRKAIKENNLVVKKVIPYSSIFGGGIKSKYICLISVYILKRK